ncbi:MAG: protein-disulfide reductase DsbD [Legionella sp.]|nr:protein-disulfide reductase DsbD [Legionella sp.]
MICIKRILFFFCISILCITANPSFSAPPPTKDVFKFKIKRQDPNTFVLEWQIKPGYFLYQNRIQLTKPNMQFIELTPLKLPRAKTKVDGLGHTISIYRHQLRIPVNIIGLSSGEEILNLRYQGCADDGFCYPPELTAIKLTINTQLALTHVNLIAPAKIPPKTSLNLDLDLNNNAFSGHHWIITLLIFLGLGLLLSLTPCVLPMIPVLSGILVGHGKNLSTRKAFFLSLSYVLSMALTYAAIGAVIALMGHNLQVLLQSPWAIISFSIVFVLLALSMFDVYDLKLPTSWQSKLAGMSYKQSRGHYVGAALMGCLSTLILSPCVTAPLIGALGFIAQTGNIALGAAALFFLGLGMGMPLLLIGASLGRFLPHAGNWMNLIKKIFGFMLLAVAIYLISRLLSAFIIMLLWGGLLIFAGLSIMRFIRSIGVILLLYGALILIGASLGNTNPLKPLTQQTSLNQHHALVVTNMRELKTALQTAHQKQQPVLLDFYADWCTSCKVIESTTLTHPDVLNALNHMQLIKIDLSANNQQSRALLHAFNVIAPPTFIFIDASGDEKKALRLVGDVSVSDLLNHLHMIN